MENNSFVEQARRAYHQAEKEKNSENRKKYYMESAENYLKAAEIFSSLDEQYRASLLFLCTVAITKAQNSRMVDTNEPEQKGFESKNVSSFEDRSLLYSTMRTKISGVRKIPKAAESNTLVDDLLQLEQRLAQIGIEKDSFSNYYNLQISMQLPSNPKQIDATTKNDLMMSKHFSSPLGESFMLLNQSIHERRALPVGSSEKPAKNISYKHPITNSNRGNLRNLSTDNKPGSSGMNEQSPWWGGIWGFSSPETKDQTTSSDKQKGIYPLSRGDVLSRSKKDELVDEPLQWNEQSIVTSTINDQKYAKFSSNGNVSATLSSTGVVDDKRSDLSREIIRLQDCIRTLESKNAELQSSLVKERETAENNKIFRKEMEEFKKDYQSKFEMIRRSFSEFAATYPAPNNPANRISEYVSSNKSSAILPTTDSSLAVHDKRMISTTLKTVNGPIRSIQSANQGINNSDKSQASASSATSSTISNTIDKSDVKGESSNVPELSASYVEQLKNTNSQLQRALTRIEKRLKDYEDYYEKQRAKLKEKKKVMDKVEGASSPDAASVSQQSGVNTTSGPAIHMNSRQSAKHPSTSTLESLQRYAKS